MPNIASLPDEIIVHLLQAIHSSGDEDLFNREIAFLNLVKVLPCWIPILLDVRFINEAGQVGPRYEDVWGFRHRVYLDERTGLWKVRDRKWQPHGAKINAWKTRNGESSHVEVEVETEQDECNVGRKGKAKGRSKKTPHLSEVEQKMLEERRNERSRNSRHK